MSKKIWCLIMSYLLFTEMQLWILICSIKMPLETCPDAWMTSGLCVFLQAQSLLQPGVAPVCRSLRFCLVLKCSREKCMWIISSEILAFSPSLKGWGVPQGWCLILAPFVSSIQVWVIPACCNLCCACSSRRGICSVKLLQLRFHVPLFSKVLCMRCYSLFSFFKLNL